jgi:3-methyladenine DNA glycosylase AlkD
MKGRSPSSSIPKKRSDAGARPRARSRREPWKVSRIVAELQQLGSRRHLEGLAHFGIHSKLCYGIPQPKLDALAKKIERSHALALELWGTGIYEARILAGMLDIPAEVTAKQMEAWVQDFDNWATCDGTCCHLFAFSAPAWEKAVAWTEREQEFQKRAGFALVAYLAYRDKSLPDAAFLRFLKVIEREAGDERNFVRKAVNWALRNIGKRNVRLNRAAIATATRLRKSEVPVTRWIAGDALRELQGDAVQRRLQKKEAAR